LPANARTNDTRSEYEDHLSTVTQEAGFAFSGKVFGLFFGFVAQVIIAKLLGADLLGVFVLAWTVIQAVSILTVFGFEGSLVRYIAMYVSQGKKGEARATFLLANRVGLAAAVLGAVAVALLRRPIAIGLFHEPRLEPALLWISIAAVPLTFMKIFGGALRGLKDVRRFVLGYDIAYRVPRLVAFLLLYFLGFRLLAGSELLGIVGASVLGCVVSFFVLMHFVRRRAPFLMGAERAPASVIPAAAIVAYSAAMLADVAMAFTTEQTDRLLLGFFLGSADVGVYNVAALVASLTIFLVLSFNAIFSSVIADVYHRGQTEILRSLFRSITRWIIVLTLPIYAWILAAGEATLSIFGQEFVPGYAALEILATGQMVAACTGPVGVCLAMTGYQRYNVWNALAMAIVSVGLNIYLIPRMGIAGAALGTGVAFVLVNVARLIEVRALLGMWPYDRSTLKVLATAAVALTGVYIVRRFVSIPKGFLSSAVVLVASVGLVAGVTMALGLSNEDRFVLRSAVERFRRSRGGS
jgi:O-antigen/teichoic acid export membrane protein